MRISIIICTHNRSDSLDRALQSLLQLRAAPDLRWEAIVVDNNSTDDTKAVVDRFAPKLDVPLIYVFEQAQGLSEARNAGLRCSQGDVISFIDDDVIVDPDFLIEIQRGFESLPVACIGGKALLPPGIKFPSWWHHSYDGPLGECDLGSEVLIGDTRNLNIIGANVSFRRSVFEKYGFFSPKVSRRGTNLVMGEESDYIRRMRQNGDFPAYLPKAVVYHVPSADRMKISYMSRWHYRRGEWEWYATRYDSSGAGTATWFGAPRWLYRALAENMLKALQRAVCVQWQEAVYFNMQTCFYAGYLLSFIRVNFEGFSERFGAPSALRRG